MCRFVNLQAGLCQLQKACIVHAHSHASENNDAWYLPPTRVCALESNPGRNWVGQVTTEGITLYMHLSLYFS